MITSQKMRELEQYALAKDISIAELMENAGKKVYNATLSKYDLTNKRVIVFCGAGNNGGDGLVAARYFATHNHVIVLLFGDKDNLSEEARDNYELIKKQINIISIHDKEELKKFRFQPHLEFVLVDALVGLGIKGEIREPLASGIDLFNSIPGAKVAVDVPSGINPDTGEAGAKVCNADLIVTFHDLKVGLEKFQDKTVVVDIGLPKK